GVVWRPGFIRAGIGLGVTSTGLASAALSAVEPAHAGMAAGLVNTLRQVGTATGVAVLGALYASRVTTATLHALAGLPDSPSAAPPLAPAVASRARPHGPGRGSPPPPPPAPLPASTASCSPLPLPLRSAQSPGSPTDPAQAGSRRPAPLQTGLRPQNAASEPPTQDRPPTDHCATRQGS